MLVLVIGLIELVVNFSIASLDGNFAVQAFCFNCQNQWLKPDECDTFNRMDLRLTGCCLLIFISQLLAISKDAEGQSSTHEIFLMSNFAIALSKAS